MCSIDMHELMVHVFEGRVRESMWEQLVAAGNLQNVCMCLGIVVD